MTIYMAVFYAIAAVMVISTVMAITRKNIVHTVLYLVVSFLGSALLFYLLGAPLLAAMEVIIYAGAIMVLFLFIVMMLTVKNPEKLNLTASHFVGMVLIAGLYLISLVALFVKSSSKTRIPMELAMASPHDFGQFLFTHHWLAIELVSFLLLVTLIGALLLGKEKINRLTSKGGRS